MTEPIRRADALGLVRRWLDEAESPLGLIEGSPGAGKSVLARQIAETFPPVLFHRCDASDDIAVSPLRFVAALARAIADEIEPFAKALVEISRPDIVINATAHADVVEAGGSVKAVHIESITIADLPAREAFDRVVRLPLEACDLPAGRQLLVVIDGLDEALGYRQRDHLVDLVQHVTAQPTPLRFLVTARSEDARISDRLGPCFLDIDRLDDGDIHRYAYGLLANLSDDRRRQMAAKIAEKGNFLYAYHIVADARTWPATADVAAVELPDGLTEIYRSFVARELAPDRRDGRWTRDIRPVLGVVACGRGRGVPRAVIAPALARPASLVADILLLCGQFLRFDDDEADGELVGIYHGSFREFLVSDAVYPVYAAEAHRSLALHLYGHVLPAGQGAGYAYALAHLPHHLAEARLNARLIELAHRREFLAAQRRHLADQPFADLGTVDAALIAAADESRPLDVAAFLLYLAARRATYAGSILDNLDRYGPEQAMASGSAYAETERTVHDLLVAAWLVRKARPDDAKLVLEALLARSPGLVTGVEEQLCAVLLTIVAPADAWLMLAAAARLLEPGGMSRLAAQLWLLGERGIALGAAHGIGDRNLRYRVFLAFRDDALLDLDHEDLDAIEEYIVESVDYHDTNPPPGQLWQMHPYLVLAVSLSLADRGEAGDARSVLHEPMVALSGIDRASTEIMLESGAAHAHFRRGDADAAAGLLADAETAAAALPDAAHCARVLLRLARGAKACGFDQEAIRLAREAYERTPELDHDVHEDDHHGWCVQGLIGEAGYVLARVGDWGGALRIAERLVGYGIRDGIDVLLAVAITAVAVGDGDMAGQAIELINEGLPGLDPISQIVAEFRVAFAAEIYGLPGLPTTPDDVVAHIEREFGDRAADLEDIDAPAEAQEPERVPARRRGDRAEELSRAAVAARASGDNESADRMRAEATRLLRAVTGPVEPRRGSMDRLGDAADELFTRAETWARLGEAALARDTFRSAMATLQQADHAWEVFRGFGGLRMTEAEAGREVDEERATRIRYSVDLGVAFGEGGDAATADEWLAKAVDAASALRYSDLRSWAAAHLCRRIIGTRPDVVLRMLPVVAVDQPALIGRLLRELAAEGDIFGEAGKELLRRASQSAEAAALALGALARSFPDAADDLSALMSREWPHPTEGRREAPG